MPSPLKKFERELGRILSTGPSWPLNLTEMMMTAVSLQVGLILLLLTWQQFRLLKRNPFARPQIDKESMYDSH